MTTPSSCSQPDPTRQVFDALMTAPEPLRRQACEAIEAGNLETFSMLMSEYLQTPTPDHPEPRMGPVALNRVDWDWLAGEILAGADPNEPGPAPPARPGS